MSASTKSRFGRCLIQSVDGEPIRVQACGKMDAEQREALAELVRSVKRLRGVIDHKLKERAGT